jgi:serine/threonine protein kinase
MPSHRHRNRAVSARTSSSFWPSGRLPLGGDERQGDTREKPQGESESLRPTPTRVGDWRLLDEIGRGAWSRVYLARPADTKRGGSGCYAVKLLDPAWEIDSLAIATLRREAIVGMTVADPHLVSVLAAHVHESPHYLVAPFLPGVSLAERLRGGRVSIRNAAWIARQVASGLAALHETNWRHRDVKPANIVVSPSGHATLVDLGMCQRRENAAAMTARPIVGSFDYLAPEAVTPGMACSVATDLYSLGVVLFEMLTGHLPFYGRTAGELAEKHRRAAPQPIAELRPNVPAELAELVRELLAKQPVRRPSSANEVVERLVRIEIATLAGSL